MKRGSDQLVTRPGAATDIGELMLREGLLTGPQLDMAIAHQKKTQKPLMRILVELNLVEENKRLNFFKRQFGVPVLAIETHRIEPILYSYIPAGLARRHHLVPVKQDKDGLVVAMEDPSDLVLLDDLKEVVGMRIKPVVASTDDIMEALAGYPEEKPPAPAARRADAFDPAARFFVHAFLPLVSLGGLAAVILLILFNQSVQAWYTGMVGGSEVTKNSQIFTLFLYFFLSWGVFTLLVYEFSGLVFDDLQWREPSDLGEPKSLGKATLLSVLVGWLGVDRFYLGYNRMALLKLVTLGLFGIWWLLDIFILLSGKMPDAAGRPLTAGQSAET